MLTDCLKVRKWLEVRSFDFLSCDLCTASNFLSNSRRLALKPEQKPKEEALFLTFIAKEADLRPRSLEASLMAPGSHPEWPVCPHGQNSWFTSDRRNTFDSYALRTYEGAHLSLETHEEKFSCARIPPGKKTGGIKKKCFDKSLRLRVLFPRIMLSQQDLFLILP